MKIVFRISTVALLLFVWGFAFRAAEPKENRISKKDLPPAVTAAFKKVYPKATIKACSQEQRGGQTCYEVESVDGNQTRDLIYAADGTVLEMEEAMDPMELPAAVRKAVAEEHPKGKIVRIEKLTKSTSVSYEVVVSEGKKQSELVLDANGKVVKP